MINTTKINGTVDQIGAEERVKRLFSRSIKKESKVNALHLVLSMLDLTTLEGKDSPGKIRQLCYKAAHLHDCYPDIPQVAAVCVYPNLVRVAKESLVGTSINVASVATGFPSGMSTVDEKLAEVRKVVKDGADEVDMVLSIGALKSHEEDLVYTDIRCVAELVHSTHRILKVILETSLLSNQEKVLACVLSKLAGADFVKTSTGFGVPGANIHDVALMHSLVGGGSTRWARFDELRFIMKAPLP